MGDELTVVDARTAHRLGFRPAFVRSVVIVLELASVPTVILALPAFVEVVALATRVEPRPIGSWPTQW